MEEERIYYIYRHLRGDTGQPFYIGRGKKPKRYKYPNREFSRAYTPVGRNRYWKNIVTKFGREVEIILDDLTYQEAFDKEIEFIKLYGRFQNGGILCNMNDGGAGSKTAGFREGDKHTPETIEKMRLAHAGKPKPPFSEEHRARIGESNKFKNHTEQGRQSRREKMTGRKYGPESSERRHQARIKNCRQVICMETGFVFDCCTDATIQMFEKKSASGVSTVCSGKRPSYKGFTFQYV